MVAVIIMPEPYISKAIIAKKKMNKEEKEEKKKTKTKKGLKQATRKQRQSIQTLCQNKNILFDFLHGYWEVTHLWPVCVRLARKAHQDDATVGVFVQ